MYEICLSKLLFKLFAREKQTPHGKSESQGSPIFISMQNIPSNTNHVSRIIFLFTNSKIQRQHFNIYVCYVKCHSNILCIHFLGYRIYHILQYCML